MASFLQRLRSGLKAFNSQQTNESYNRFIYNFLGNNTISNNEYSDDYIEKGYAYNPTIYSLIQLISKSAVTVPYSIYKKVDDGAMKEYKALTSNNLNEDSVLKAKLLRKHTLEEVEHSALGKLLERPNPAQSWAVFLEELIGFGKLTGNRYIYGITPENGENKNIYYQLYNLPAHLIEIKSEGIFKPISKYTMMYNDNKYDLTAEEVLHIADFNPDYSSDGTHLYGQSPIQAGMRVLTTSNEAVETNLKFLHNQSARGMLTPDDDQLTPTQAQQMKDAFRRNFQGSKSANDVMITGKKFSWINFGLSTADLQLLESYNATVKDLCNLYGVPVQLLNNTESTTYDNYRTARKVLFTNAVIPELNKIRDEFNRWLVPMFGEDLYFDFDYSAVPELMPEQEKLVDTLSKSYWLTANEKRQAQGYGVDDENPIMNDYLVPSNFVPMNDLDMGINDDVAFPEVEEPEEMIEEEEIEEIIVEEEEKKNKKKININKAISDEIYTSEEQAQERANEIGCELIHSHETEDGIIYMPCKDMQELEEALKENKQEYYDDYPKSARKNAERGKKINEEFNNPCATLVGKGRATDLIAGKPLSLTIVKKTFSYLSRAHEYVTGEYLDEKGKPICGDVSFALWGGNIKTSKVEDDAMWKWCKRIIDKSEE
jgi:HK97 family phage portal protein